MPGLFGYVTQRGFEPPRDPDRLLSEMAARLTHRDDYKIDRWTSSTNSLAVWRIGKRFRSQVPWPRSDQSVRVFVDGVLHDDALAPGRLQAEAAAAGGDLVALMRGFFSCAVVDDDRDEVTLAVDHHASRPLIFTNVGGVVYFAPEVKALLAIPGLTPRPDDASLGMLLACGWLLSHQTMFTDFRRLRGGEKLVVARGTHKLSRYWQYVLSERGDATPEDQLEDELGGLIKRAVGRNLTQADSSLILFSGGIDSRAIAAAAHSVTSSRGSRLHTVTFAHDPALPQSDAVVVEALASRFGFEHSTFERPLAQYGTQFLATHYLLDGISDGAAFHPYEPALIAKCVERGRECILRGDECFGWASSVSTQAQARLEIGLRPLGGQTLWQRFLRPSAWDSLVPAADAALAELDNEMVGYPSDVAKDLMYEGQRLQGMLQPLAYGKMITADHRNPLLDADILSFNGRIPSRLRINKTLFRRACARTFPEFWMLPVAKRPNLVDWPAQLTSDTSLHRYLQSELADRRSAVWDLLDREALVGHLDLISRRTDHTGFVARTKRQLFEVARSVRRVPVVGSSIHRRYKRGVVRVDQLYLRVLALKAWYDLFYQGGGARGVYLGRKQEAAD